MYVYTKEGVLVKILMLGWEFPPFFAGGIGIVCYELSKALADKNVEVTYIMPFGPRNTRSPFLKKLITAENMYPTIKVHRVDTMMHAYMNEETYTQEYTVRMLEEKTSATGVKKQLYGKNLLQEVHNFAHRAMLIAEHEEFDIIHCHDWMTVPAAIGIKHASKKPLIVHMHNTVFDRYLQNTNSVEYDIEQRGLDEADKVLCVSHFIRNTVLTKYHADEQKVGVLHNAAQKMSDAQVAPPTIQAHDRIVLFAGRITVQKGPDYFVKASRLVADHMPDVKFVMAGTGDMLTQMIELVADLGLGDKFLFPGFYTRDDVDTLFSMADVFVMPSVSEPFGIVPLEAMYKGTPTIISKQSGCSEVLAHVLKVDFWDVEELAEKILAVLAYEELHQTLRSHGKYEVTQLTWDKVADRMKREYEQLCIEVKR